MVVLQMRIVWNAYIAEQLHWAERLEEIAESADAEHASTLAQYARRAVMNAHSAADEQIAASHMR